VILWLTRNWSRLSASCCCSGCLLCLSWCFVRTLATLGWGARSTCMPVATIPPPPLTSEQVPVAIAPFSLVRCPSRKLLSLFSAPEEKNWNFRRCELRCRHKPSWLQLIVCRTPRVLLSQERTPCFGYPALEFSPPLRCPPFPRSGEL